MDNYRNIFECRSKRKATLFRETCRRHLLMVLWYGRSCKEICVERCCELANETTQQLHKVATPCLDDHQFKEEEMGSVGEVVKSTPSNCSDVYIWRALVDQTFYGLWTNLLEQSLNGPELATDAWFVGFHTFITHLICDNIFMWETRLSIVDWVCSKTRALLETLKTQNQPWGKSYVSSEVEHLFP